MLLKMPTPRTVLAVCSHRRLARALICCTISHGQVAPGHSPLSSAWSGDRDERHRLTSAARRLGNESAPEREELVRLSDGLTMHYWVQGSGRTIVVLSGGPGLSSRYLIPVADSIAAFGRVVRPDLRGTGKSVFASSPAAGTEFAEPRSQTLLSEQALTLQRLAIDIEELRAKLGVPKLLLFGHSFGAVIALEYAARYPDHVKGLVLVSAPGTDTSFVSSSEAIMRSRVTTSDRDSVRYWLSRRQLDSTLADAELWRLNHKAYMHDPDAVKKVQRDPEGYVRDVHDQLMHAFMNQRDLRRRIRQYSGPSLLIYGSDDIYDRRTIDRLNTDLGRARVILIEKAGHFPWAEEPDAFYAAIRDELSRVP